MSRNEFNVYMKKEEGEEDTKREELIDSLVEDTDEHCIGLITFFRIHKDRVYGFNKLFRLLKKERRNYGVSFTRQTLGLHLKHLLEKHIIEVNIDVSSKLMIKPRMYQLSSYWRDFFYKYDRIKNVAQISKELRNEPIENVAATFMELSVNFCARSFIEIIQSPKFWGATEAKYISNMIQHLAMAFQEMASKRNKEKKALDSLQEINTFLRQKLREKYFAEKEPVLDIEE